MIQNAVLNITQALGENTGLTRVFGLSIACNARQNNESYRFMGGWGSEPIAL